MTTSKKVVCLVLLMAVFFYILWNYVDRIDREAHTQNIDVKDEIDIMIKSKSNSRRVLFLNGNEIKLYDFYPILNQDELQNKIKKEEIGYTIWENPDKPEYKPTLNDIKPPYRLIKRKGSDTLRIIKEPDTILVHLKAPEPKKDPNDPTFKELFQRLFGKD